MSAPLRGAIGTENLAKGADHDLGPRVNDGNIDPQILAHQDVAYRKADRRLTGPEDGDHFVRINRHAAE